MYSEFEHLQPVTQELSDGSEKWMRKHLNDRPYFVKRIRTYNELSELLAPLRGDSAGLVFRGQASWRWKLYSKYERALQEVDKRTGNISHRGRKIHVENKDPALKAIKRRLDIHGAEYDGQLLAVLQHYGASTTLLDWTASVDVALFFAAKYSASPCTKYGTVFICNTQRVNKERNVDGESRTFCGSKFYETNGFFDQRLHVQKGLFLMTPLRGLSGFIPSPLDDAAKGKIAEQSDMPPPSNTLFKVNFSRSLCSQILDDLEKRGVTYETLFPREMEDVCKQVELDILGKLSG